MGIYQARGGGRIVNAEPFVPSMPGVVDARQTDGPGGKRVTVFGLQTRDGWLFPQIGDWVITDADRRKSVVSAADFAASFEEVST
jgi:hypothetical protein